MKKKLLWCTGIAILISLIVLGVLRYIEVRNRQTDLNWKLAEQIYKMENALKEVDEDYECKSISKVTPYTYEDSAGNTIIYYCCQTTYIEDEYGETTGLNTDAIGMVIDFAQIQNRQDCKVNGQHLHGDLAEMLGLLIHFLVLEFICLVDFCGGQTLQILKESIAQRSVLSPVFAQQLLGLPLDHHDGHRDHRNTDQQHDGGREADKTQHRKQC